METKRLYRSRKPKMIGGVCAGLAKYLNLDVVLVRIIFAIGLFVPICDTMFFLAYIALWIATPFEPEVEEVVEEPVVDVQEPNTQYPPEETVI